MSARRSSKRGPEGPASDAPEADRGRPKRKVALPGAAAHVADAAGLSAAEDRRLAADTAKAKAASRREAFDKIPSTEGLWAWGKDCVGWKVPAASMHKRDVVLDALVVIDAPVVKTKKEFADNWRRHLGIADKKAAPPSDTDEEEVNEAAAFAQAARDKKAAAAAAAAAPAAAAASQRAIAPSPEGDRRPTPTRACEHCMSEAQHATPAFRCADCGMRSDLPFDAPINVHLRGAASSSSGQSDTETSSVRTPKEALSRRDKELERLAEEGAPFPRFDDAAPNGHVLGGGP